MMSSYSCSLKTSSSPLNTCHGKRKNTSSRNNFVQTQSVSKIDEGKETDSGEQVELGYGEKAAGVFPGNNLSCPLLPAVLLLSSGERGGGMHHRSFLQQLVSTGEQLTQHNTLTIVQ